MSQFKLTPPEKERLVDLICAIKFSTLFPHDQRQPMGDSRIDPFLNAQALDDLPSTIRSYVQRYPR